MLLREFAIYIERKQRTGLSERELARAWGRGVVMGHAYAQSLGRYVTRGTWKVMVEIWPADEPSALVRVNSCGDDPLAGGVAMVSLCFDVRRTPLVGDDEIAARLFALNLIHDSTLEVASDVNWDPEALIQAFETVEAFPRYVESGAWKQNRKRTRSVRVVFEENWQGVDLHVETRDNSGVVTRHENIITKYGYLTVARKDIGDPIFKADGVVVLRSKQVPFRKRERELVVATLPD